ncbi:MAG: glutamyl-tRNA reductase [Propionicimonas sp.]
MPVTAVGISHHLVALDDLAGLSQTAEHLTAALAIQPELTGHVLLNTCNRFEVYFDSPGFHAALESVLGTLRQELPPSRRGLVDQFEVYAGQAAVQHLLEVASGLDSMIVGENEVIGQVRDALATGSSASPSLQRLFHAALTTGKAVSSQTDLGAAGRSIAVVALDLVEARHFPLAGRRALVVGTGSYARVVIAALLRLGCTDLWVHSPSGRAERFAASHPVHPVPHDGLDRALALADVVVTCSGGDRQGAPAITAAAITRARAGATALLPVLDLSLTSDVEPEACALLTIDVIDLDEVGAHAPAEQAVAVLAARDLVARGVDTYLHLEHGRAATPAVTAIRAHVSQFIEREIEAAARRYDPETSAAVAHSLRRVSNALLHTPSLRAAEFARSGDLADYSHALHTLFGIDIEVDA